MINEIKTTITRSGRESSRPIRLELNRRNSIWTINTNFYEILAEDKANASEEYPEDKEIVCVGAGLGGGIYHTSELHAMKFKNAMKSEDEEKCHKAVAEEHDRMVKMNVC